MGVNRPLGELSCGWLSEWNSCQSCSICHLFPWGWPQHRITGTLKCMENSSYHNVIIVMTQKSRIAILPCLFFSLLWHTEFFAAAAESLGERKGGEPTTELCFIYANCCIWLGKWCPIGSCGQHIIAWLMAVELAVLGRLQWVEENRCSLTVGAECHPRLETTSGERRSRWEGSVDMTPSFLVWLLWMKGKAPRWFCHLVSYFNGECRENKVELLPFDTSLTSLCSAILMATTSWKAMPLKVIHPSPKACLNGFHW